MNSKRLSILRELSKPLEEGPEPTECENCESTMEIDDCLEPTRICNTCAQLVIIEDIPAILDELDNLRKVDAETIKEVRDAAFILGALPEESLVDCATRRMKEFQKLETISKVFVIK